MLLVRPEQPLAFPIRPDRSAACPSAPSVEAVSKAKSAPDTGVSSVLPDMIRSWQPPLDPVQLDSAVKRAITKSASPVSVFIVTAEPGRSTYVVDAVEKAALLFCTRSCWYAAPALLTVHVPVAATATPAVVSTTAAMARPAMALRARPVSTAPPPWSIRRCARLDVVAHIGLPSN